MPETSKQPHAADGQLPWRRVRIPQHMDVSFDGATPSGSKAHVFYDDFVEARDALYAELREELVGWRVDLEHWLYAGRPPRPAREGESDFLCGTRHDGLGVVRSGMSECNGCLNIVEGLLHDLPRAVGHALQGPWSRFGFELVIPLVEPNSLRPRPERGR